MDNKSLEDALVLTVHDIFEGSQRDELSVNNVRKQCEEKNGLADGFFASTEWKTRSKTIIKGKVVSSPSRSISRSRAGDQCHYLFTPGVCLSPARTAKRLIQRIPRINTRTSLCQPRKKASLPQRNPAKKKIDQE